MTKEVKLTREGFEKIKNEHEELVSVRRKEVAERIKEARAFGDISENAEYDAAKNEQAELEEQILKLENMMRQAKIIEESHTGRGKVNVGSKVTIKDIKADKEIIYTILGAAEADPFEGKISNESAIGAGLIGHKKGDEVEIETPSGTKVFEIIDIDRLK